MMMIGCSKSLNVQHNYRGWLLLAGALTERHRPAHSGHPVPLPPVPPHSPRSSILLGGHPFCEVYPVWTPSYSQPLAYLVAFRQITPQSLRFPMGHHVGQQSARGCPAGNLGVPSQTVTVPRGRPRVSAALSAGSIPLFVGWGFRGI